MEIVEIKNSFKAFDSFNGRIELKDAYEAILSTGFYIPYDKFDGALQTYSNNDSNQDITWDQYLKICQSLNMLNYDVKSGLSKLFAQFENKPNEISMDELKFVLQTLGNKAVEEKVQNFLKELKVNTDNMTNHHDLVNKLFS